MNETRHLYDLMGISDEITKSKDTNITHGSEHRGFRTSITAVSDLGEVLFEEEQNTQVLGGSISTLESLFGVKSKLDIEDLNTVLNIATGGPDLDEEQLKSQNICLFGVGIGGSGDTLGSVLDVDYKSRTLDGMIPLRVTDQPLLDNEAERYGFRKKNEDGTTSYYLKTFDAAPEIHVLWADGEGDEDGSAVEDNPHESPREDKIEAFVELRLTIDKKDLREYFESQGTSEVARFNTLGLFFATKGEVADGLQDYKGVRLYSKFNFNNEPLDLPKSITFYYRIYTS